MSDEKTALKRLTTNEENGKGKRKNCVSRERGLRVSLKFKYSTICVCIVCTQFLIYFIFFSSPSTTITIWICQVNSYDFGSFVRVSDSQSHSSSLSCFLKDSVYIVVIHKLDTNKNPFGYYFCFFFLLPIFQWTTHTECNILSFNGYNIGCELSHHHCSLNCDFFSLLLLFCSALLSSVLFKYDIHIFLQWIDNSNNNSVQQQTEKKKKWCWFESKRRI